MLSLDIYKEKPDFIANREFNTLILSFIMTTLVIFYRLDALYQIIVMELEVLYEDFSSERG